MKKIVFSLLVLLTMLQMADAQSSKKHAYKKPAVQKTSTQLTSTTSHTAKSQISIADHYTIKGPVHSFSADSPYVPRIPNPATYGVPKSAYGFANGHIMLNTSGAISSGGITGNGSVGTGSSPGGVGNRSYGINGKSPYAGFSMWGNARGLTLYRGDSSVRPARF